VITEKAIERVVDVLAIEGCLPYTARVRDFTDEQVEAGELRRADREAAASNRAFARDVLSAAMTDLAAGWLVAQEGRRCPSCDHLIEHHLSDGCWHEVSSGEVGADLVCPCAMSEDVATASRAAQYQPGVADVEGYFAERTREAAAEQSREVWADPTGRWTADQADAARAQKHAMLRVLVATTEPERNDAAESGA
jgi:hypothetical protein